MWHPLAVSLLAALLLSGSGCGRANPRPLLFATTTSVQDSGLLDALLPDFTAQTGIRVRVIAVGTGAALRMGREGNADLLLTHAPEAERALVDQGAADSRVPIMENQFVLAGPIEDPLRLAEALSIADALRRVSEAGGPWLSRGDDSGTHRREQALWRMAGLDPDPSGPGFIRTGAGMGLSLQVAGERRAYLLSDLGTFLAFRERTGLAALSGDEPALRNVYSVLLVNPERFDGRVLAEPARALERFLRSEPVQRRIAEFGRARFGEPLFRPIRDAGDA